MRKPLFIFVLLAAALVPAISIATSTEQISFVNIGLGDGLSHNTVFSITQDRRGNMWFATFDGVNKFDGYGFTAYQNDRADSTTIANNMVRTVFTDSRGRVWVGTRDGLSLYDETLDVFHNFRCHPDKNIQVNGIAELSPSRLLISTNGGLLIFDVDTGRFSVDALSNCAQRLNATSLSRAADNIYIGTADGGLFVYNTENDTLIRETRIPVVGQILSVLLQRPSTLWVATEGAGLYSLEIKSGKTKNYRHNGADPSSIGSDYVRSLAFDARGRLWVGTFNGLSIYEPESDSFTSYISDPSIEGSLSQSSIRSVFMDSQGGMWLGTYFGGINYYHPLKHRFRNIRHVPNRNSLNDNVVNCITGDNSGNFWIGTNDGGLDFYEVRTGRFTHYTIEPRNSSAMGSNNIKAVYTDDDAGLVYIGTHGGGFNILNRSTGHITRYTQQNSPLVDNNVYSVISDGAGGLWLGTLGGLMRFDKSSKALTLIAAEADGRPMACKSIFALLHDSRNRLWVGTEEGVFIYDNTPKGLSGSRILPEESPLRNAYVNDIMEASDSAVWVATREGLYGVGDSGPFVHYDTEDGLLNNVIYGVLEDSFGRLWASSNRGLSCINTYSGRIRNFTEADGLQSNQFNPSSRWVTDSGQMYFGGINGISTFCPETLLDNPYAPSVVIDRLMLFNERVRPGDATGILSRNINSTSGITLKASQSAFTLGYVVANFIAGKHNTFAYMLEGYDRDWIYTNTRSVSYSNLPHGTYLFRVKAANNDGKWNSVPTELEITILPVWYKTWWAATLFLMCFLALAVFVFRYFWMRKSMAAEIEYERRDKEYRDEVNQTKTRFFINISHEIRTPLTLILAPLQELVGRTTDAETLRQLNLMKKNANRLLHLVNQLMDYRRAELGVFRLRARRGDAEQVVRENFSSYEALAQSRKMDYTLNSSLGGPECLFDGDYLELVLNNLLSNAFKFTGEGGRISVDLALEGEWLVLRVSDTGIGIPIDRHARVFERFYQAESEYAGSGIGLSLVQRLVELHHGRIEVESEEGVGSIFTVFIPQDESMYSETEMYDGTENAAGRQVYTTNPRDMYLMDVSGDGSASEKQIEECCGTVLVVDDNEDICALVAEGFEGSVNVLTARNGQEALDVIGANEVDVVITDVMMPVMDGVKLCRKIKQNIRTCHIPVIMLSAKSDVADQMEGLQVGADDYIPKPFVMSAIRMKVENLLRTRIRALERYAGSVGVVPEKIAFNRMDREMLEAAVAAVERNLGNAGFTADDFAGEMNMSRSNLHLKLKAITGESATDFIRRIRFNAACGLLKDGRYSVAEVSERVGFSSPSYFATSFRKYFGCMPRDYVKKVKGK